MEIEKWKKMKIGDILWLEYPRECVRRVPNGWIHIIYSPMNVFSSPPPEATFIPENLPEFRGGK